MSEIPVRSWEEANQACLMAALAEVRATLEKLLSISETQNAGDASDAGASLVAAALGQPRGLPLNRQTILEDVRDSMAVPPALDTLCATFGLTSFERKILLMCAGVELDSRFAGLYAAANKDHHQSLPTFSLALAAFEDAHWSALLPAQPLRFWHLVEVGAGDALTTSALRIDERILHYLAGLPSIDERLRSLTTPLSLGGELPASQRDVAEQVAGSWSRTNGQPPWPAVQLCGNDLAANRAVATEACARLGLHLRVMSAQVVPRGTADLDLFIRLWEREVALHPHGLLVECDDAETTDVQGDTALKRLVETLHSLLLISTRERLKPVERQLISFEVPKATSTEQLQIWKEALGAAALRLDGRVETLVTQFNLCAGKIHAAVAQAISGVGPGIGSTPADPSLGSEPALSDGVMNLRLTTLHENARSALECVAQHGLWSGAPHSKGAFGTSIQASENAWAAVLWDACRIQARPRLEGLAQRIEPAATWEDLVLPEMQKQLLNQIALHVRQRAKVYQTWGFASKASRGLGISALFAGPSGTGKTMAGEVLANELRLDLYRIDLSQVVSKYIGETEKNLRRVFDAAEGGAAILLFDEADALFGKRSEVKDSHDRYANIEVGYLLQRMETYRGLAILTTNRKEAVDFAFLRRIRFVVEFPFPEAPQRAEIWRRVFPRQTPTEGLRVERLARLSAAGGNIYNIAMGAAFLAADAGEPVRMSHLLAAARSEFTKLERPLTDSETSGWV